VRVRLLDKTAETTAVLEVRAWQRPDGHVVAALCTRAGCKCEGGSYGAEGWEPLYRVTQEGPKRG